MKNKSMLLIFIAIFTLVLVGCSNNKSNQSNKEDHKLNVVVTNSILADITKNIAGNKIDLHSIVPIGRDPHEYEPLPEDVQKTSKADIIFYNGLNLETGGNAWFTKLVKNANKKENMDYFPVSNGVKTIYLEGKNADGKEDPHAWLNLENGIIYAKNIEQQLINKDPANEEFYKKNLEKYINKLKKLDDIAKVKFSSIPESQKMIVTSEGCFKYFSKAYNIPSAYIWEINTEEEGTPDQIKSLVRKLRGTNLRALFVESSVDKRSMKTLSQDTSIPIYSTLFTDSIAENGQNGDSYYSMMKWNIDQIYTGLSK